MPQSEEINYALETIGDEEISLAAGTLTGDVRDALLGHIKAQKKPWPQLSQFEQTDVISAANTIAENLVRQAVRVIAAQGRETISAKLDKVEIKDGLKLTATCLKREQTMLALGLAQGHEVLIIAASADDYTGEREPAKATPDQRDFIDEE